MRHSRLAITLLFALIGHAVLIMLWPLGLEKRLPRIFDVELSIPEREVIAAPETSEIPDLPAVEPRPAENRLVEQIVQPESAETTPALNLERPPDINEPVEDLIKSFRPDLKAGIDRRQREKSRRQLHQSRRVLTEGLSEEAYFALEGPVSGHFKTAKGCFSLRDDLGEAIGLKGLEKRWWRTGCKEVRYSPFVLPGVEYDRLGRAIGP